MLYSRMFIMLEESLAEVDAFIVATNLAEASMEAVEEQLFDYWSTVKFYRSKLMHFFPIYI